jgi:DNA sulfur modification protein DndC
MLKQIRSSLEAIRNFAKKNNLPVEVFEVHPSVKNTLNVQLLGVGMPPPNGSFRWCTDKLKKIPTDTFVVEHFGNSGFITITGVRRSEGFSRAASLQEASRPGTDLKFNDRYRNSANLTPIEHWNVKDVWSFLFSQGDRIVDATVLWDLYSDASGKTSDECSFVGAGGKEIDEGKIGCGVSRFGCWQCYLTRGEDRALGGLLKSGHEDIDLYIEYRNWFWELNQRGWSLVRDAYAHSVQQNQTLFTSGGIKNPKFGMTQARGLRLHVRIAAFKKLMRLQSKLKDKIISLEEIIAIQERWLREGDLKLTAFWVYVEGKKQNKDRLDEIAVAVAKFKPIIDKAFLILKEDLDELSNSNLYSRVTLNRMAIQLALGKNIKKQFYPTRREEKQIRQQWKRGFMSDEEKIEAFKSGIIKVPTTTTLLGKTIDRDELPEHLHDAAFRYLQMSGII